MKLIHYLVINRLCIALGIAMSQSMLITMPALAGDNNHNVTYRYEAGVHYSNRDTDSSINLKSLGTGIQIFTSAIAYQDAPYAEASFLDRSSFFTAEINTVDVDFNSVTAGGSLKGELMGIGFVYADKQNPFVAGITVKSANADNTIHGVDVNFRLDVIDYLFGYYLNNHSLLSMLVQQNDIELDTNNTRQVDINTTDYRIHFKNVLPLASSRFVNLEAGYASIDENNNRNNTEISISGDYYPEHISGIGARVGFNSGDNHSDEGTAYEIRLVKFLTKRTQVKARFDKFVADQANNDKDEIRVSLSHRFR